MVYRDGIRFQGLRYLYPTLAAYVGEPITIRYDPRDLGEIRVFHLGRFLCRAISPEHAGQALTLKDIQTARTTHRRELRNQLNQQPARTRSRLHTYMEELELVPCVSSARPPAFPRTDIGAPMTASVPAGIDSSAPVVARHAIDIKAPVETVWRLHSHVNSWVGWQTDIDSARIEGPFAPGTTFNWSTSGMTVPSTIILVDEERRTLWGGLASGIDGLHEWVFTATLHGTHVETNESWSGDVVTADPVSMKSTLDSALAAWLQRLKTAAEAEAQEPRTK